MQKGISQVWAGTALIIFFMAATILAITMNWNEQKTLNDKSIATDTKLAVSDDFEPYTPQYDVDTEDTEKYLIVTHDGIDADERDLIERVVAAEARGECYRGIVAVCQVIKDRGDLWNRSYSQVVMQSGQFADPYQGEISDLVKTAVHEVFDLGILATEDPITHFYDHEILSEPPYWAEYKVKSMEIGCHSFYY